MKNFLKNVKGFTAIVLSIAMILALIFVTIMTSMSYNSYTSSIEAKRTAVAVNYAVDIFEHIGELNFNEVTASDSLFNIEAISDFETTSITLNENGVDYVRGEIGTYEIELGIQDYNNAGKIKIISLTITYPVSRKNTEKVEFQRLKTI